MFLFEVVATPCKPGISAQNEILYIGGSLDAATAVVDIANADDPFQRKWIVRFWEVADKNIMELLIKHGKCIDKSNSYPTNNEVKTNDYS